MKMNVNISKIFGKSNKVFIDFFKILNENHFETKIISDANTAYREVPQFRMAVDLKSRMFSNAELFLSDLKGNRIDSGDYNYINNVLLSPNIGVDLNDFLFNIKRNHLIEGGFIVKIVKADKDNSGSKFSLSKLEIQKINNFKNESDAKLFVIDTDSDSTIAPIYKSLEIAISNIKESYNFRNSILSNLGALGMISPASPVSNNNGVYFNLTGDEKIELEKEYDLKYGKQKNKTKMLLFDKPMRYDYLSYPTKDLMLFEEVSENTNTIMDVLGLSDKLISNDATYENKMMGEVQTYENTIIPEMDMFTQKLTNKLRLMNIIPSNLKISSSYSHVKSLAKYIKSQEMILVERQDQQ